MGFFGSKRSLFSLGIIILAILLTAYFAIDNLRLQEYDGVRINLAGRQRMLSQKITKEIILYNYGDGGEEAVRSTAAFFETTLLALKDGGNAPLDLSMTEFKTLPEMEDKETKDQLVRIANSWGTFRQNLESVLENKDASSVNYIIDQNTKLLDEIDSVVVMMQHNAEARITRVYLIIASGILVSILVLIYAIVGETKRKYVSQLENRVIERTRELEAATQKDEVASHSKSVFMGNMSHELKTPLTGIIGYTDVLRQQYFGELNEKQTQYTDRILEGSQHLLSKVDDILDIANYSSDTVELEVSEVRVKDVIDASLTSVREKADSRKIRLTLDLPPDIEGLEMMADERKFKQVLLNLLSNAVQFTPDGGSIQVTGKLADGNLEVTVADTGIGLSAENLDRVFEEFYQVEGDLQDKTAGIGLGLSIARKYVLLHDGAIRAESAGPGQGSRFIFSLPAAV